MNTKRYKCILLREQGSFFSSCHLSTLFCFAGQSLQRVLQQYSNELHIKWMQLWNLSFSQHTAPANPQSYYPFNHTQSDTLTQISRFWGRKRERRIGSLTDITIPGNRVESGRRSSYADIWVDVMKSRTFSLWSCVTSSNPETLPPYFWQISHQNHVQA